MLSKMGLCSNVIQSEDEMDEFFAVSVSLSAQNVKEDKNDDVIGDTLGILDDTVSNQKDNSDILETVAGQKESNTGSFNGISEGWFNFLVDVAWVIDWFNVVDEGQKFSFSFNIIGVLGLK